MTPPKIKKEIVVNTCPNKNALSIQVSTPRAFEWLLKNGPKYTADQTFEMLLKTSRLPAETVLIVSRCFDIEEVKKHLESPLYEGRKISLIERKK